MDIYDTDGSVRHDISEAVEAISRYLESHPLPSSCFTLPLKLADAASSSLDPACSGTNTKEKAKKV